MINAQIEYLDIFEAVVQGWCKPETGDRIMDVVLAHAIIDNLVSMLEEKYGIAIIGNKHTIYRGAN